MFDYIILIVAIILASISLAKKASWRKKAEQAKEDSGGNASFFWSAELDEWHEITVYPDTIDVRPEQVNGEDHDWKKRTYVEIDHSNLEIEQGEEEIPFWCQDDFFDELLSSPEDSGTIEMKYKRTKKGGTNRGKFRLSED